MYIKSIDLKQIFRSKKTKWLVVILSVILISIISVYTLYKVSKISNGEKIKNITEYIGSKQDSIFNMTSYEAEYDMIVVSNKNVNSYNIKEVYDSGRTKYEYLDSTGSKVCLVINKDKIKIQNENQKNVMIQDFGNIGLGNLISISTFLDIYNNREKQDNKLDIDINQYLKNEYLKIILKVKEEYNENILKDISSIELDIDTETKLPSTYVVCNKNKKEVVSIVYTKFNINPKIDSKIFDIY